MVCFPLGDFPRKEVGEVPSAFYEVELRPMQLWKLKVVRGWGRPTLCVSVDDVTERHLELGWGFST